MKKLAFLIILQVLPAKTIRLFFRVCTDTSVVNPDWSGHF